LDEAEEDVVERARGLRVEDWGRCVEGGEWRLVVEGWAGVIRVTIVVVRMRRMRRMRRVRRRRVFVVGRRGGGGRHGAVAGVEG
jgi:hypothetical protein